jgi:Na+-translocating ferredoxin:NAD+ oxidoreductase subunit B
MPDQETPDPENRECAAEVTPSQVNALLPQTQCTKCGFNGCLPYAQAIVAGQAAVNRCPPGGQAGIKRLAALTGLPELPLDESCGLEQPRSAAWIDPSHCIGCTLCIEACPVDAIIGAAKAMHAVIAPLCTGCELCVVPCPVDCIEMRPVARGVAASSEASATFSIPRGWTDGDAAAARQRFERRNARIQSEARQADSLRKNSIIAAALAKARERLMARASTRR